MGVDLDWYVFNKERFEQCLDKPLVELAEFDDKESRFDHEFLPRRKEVVDSFVKAHNSISLNDLSSEVRQTLYTVYSFSPLLNEFHSKEPAAKRQKMTWSVVPFLSKEFLRYAVPFCGVLLLLLGMLIGFTEGFSWLLGLSMVLFLIIALITLYVPFFLIWMYFILTKREVLMNPSIEEKKAWKNGKQEYEKYKEEYEPFLHAIFDILTHQLEQSLGKEVHAHKLAFYEEIFESLAYVKHVDFSIYHLNIMPNEVVWDIQEQGPLVKTPLFDATVIKNLFELSKEEHEQFVSDMKKHRSEQYAKDALELIEELKPALEKDLFVCQR